MADLADVRAGGKRLGTRTAQRRVARFRCLRCGMKQANCCAAAGLRIHDRARNPCKRRIKASDILLPVLLRS